MSVLNQTGIFINRDERNKINENWIKIAKEITYLQSQIVYLAGNQEVFDLIDRIETAITNAISSTAGATEAELRATEAAIIAIEATKNANEQATFANSQGNYAKEKGNIAITASNNADIKASYANTQGQFANSQGSYAKSMGDYSKGQGDFASEQGNLARIKLLELQNISVVQYNDRLLEIERKSDIFEQDLDIVSLQNVNDSNIVIAHNTNSYPQVLMVMDESFGHGGYGVYTIQSKYQVVSLVEYIDENNIRLLTGETFSGTPTISKVTEGVYSVKFSNEDVGITVYLK